MNLVRDLGRSQDARMILVESECFDGGFLGGWVELAHERHGSIVVAVRERISSSLKAKQ